MDVSLNNEEEEDNPPHLSKHQTFLPPLVFFTILQQTPGSRWQSIITAPDSAIIPNYTCLHLTLLHSHRSCLSLPPAIRVFPDLDQLTQTHLFHRQTTERLIKAPLVVCCLNFTQDTDEWMMNGWPHLLHIFWASRRDHFWMNLWKTLHILIALKATWNLGPCRVAVLAKNEEI